MNPANDRILRWPEVHRRVGIGRTTVHERMKAGTFPRSVKLGANSTGWHESDIVAWIADPMGWGRAAA